MDYIPYYDFSFFPVNSNNLIDKIKLSAQKNFNSIFINWGEFFPWSEDTLINSNFAYTEKLIEKTVNICKESNINLIPVLSVLVNSDYILKDNKYKYLLNDGLKQNGLNIFSCGIAKLIEQLIDDIFSLTEYSEYILLQIPDITKIETNSKQVEAFVALINRLTDYLSRKNKTLIIDWEFYADNCIFMNNNNKYSLKKAKKYNLDINIFTFILKGIKYKVLKFSGTDNFNGNLDIGEFFPDNIKNYSFLKTLDKLESFYLILDIIWDEIRISWENLSLFYNCLERVQQLQFMRSVIQIKQTSKILEAESITVSIIFEDYFQPQFFKNWMDAKMNSTLNQINTLESISKQMSDGKY